MKALNIKQLNAVLLLVGTVAMQSSMSQSFETDLREVLRSTYPSIVDADLSRANDDLTSSDPARFVDALTILLRYPQSSEYPPYGVGHVADMTCTLSCATTNLSALKALRGLCAYDARLTNKLKEVDIEIQILEEEGGVLFGKCINQPTGQKE